jgi:hypothetical protein
MRHEVRPAPLPSWAGEASPECMDAPMGYENLSALLRGLLGALEQRWKGSIVVRHAGGLPATVLLFRGGHVVAGRLHGAADLFQAVFSLCSEVRPADISFASNIDLVGSGPWVTHGALDTLSLTAAVIRSADAESCVADAIRFIGKQSIIARAKVAFDRYAFSPAERSVLDVIDCGPLTLSELVHCTGLPRAVVERVVFTLWVTRAVSLAPTWLRVVSGPISQPSPPLDQSPDEERTMVMRSFIRSKGSYSERAPANGVTDLWDPPDDDPESQPAADSPQATADRHFRMAELLLQRGHAREAVFEAQKALRLCQPKPDQRALYAWALYERGGGGPNVPAHVWEHLETALLADPQCARARYYRGLLQSQSELVAPISSGRSSRR